MGDVQAQLAVQVHVHLHGHAHLFPLGKQTQVQHVLDQEVHHHHGHHQQDALLEPAVEELAADGAGHLFQAIQRALLGGHAAEGLFATVAAKDVEQHLGEDGHSGAQGPALQHRVHPQQLPPPGGTQVEEENPAQEKAEHQEIVLGQDAQQSDHKEQHSGSLPQLTPPHILQGFQVHQHQSRGNAGQQGVHADEHRRGHGSHAPSPHGCHQQGQHPIGEEPGRHQVEQHGGEQAEEHVGQNANPLAHLPVEQGGDGVDDKVVDGRVHVVFLVVVGDGVVQIPQSVHGHGLLEEGAVHPGVQKALGLREEGPGIVGQLIGIDLIHVVPGLFLAEVPHHDGLYRQHQHQRQQNQISFLILGFHALSPYPFAPLYHT